MAFDDIMVDIETTGTRPDQNHIIQIAAVRFDFASREIDHNFFDRCLIPCTMRHWDEETRNWWMGKNRQVYASLVPRMEPAANVMHAFRDWVTTGREESQTPIRFWAKPTTFDFMFIASYFHQYEIDIPFHYRHAVDLNSYLRGLQNDPLGQLDFRQFEGAKHNALVDTLNQVGNLFAAVDAIKGGAKNGQEV